MAGNILSLGDYLRIRVWTRLGTAGQAAVNTFHFFVSSVGSVPATDLDAAIFFDSVLAPMYKAILNVAAEYRGVQAQILRASPPYAARFTEAQTNTNAGAGTVAGNLLPHQACGLGSFFSPLAGSANRGRVFSPFASTASDDGTGSPSATYQTNLSFIVGAILTPWNIVNAGRTASCYQVIMHRTNKAGTIPLPTQVTSGTVSTRWATQRRRGQFGRLNTSPL